MEDLKKIFNDVASLKVGVMGDVMLDTYMWGKVDRISPEAPVPIVSLHKKEYRIGGAGNVALNCRSLGADVSVISVTGDDGYGIQLKELMDNNQINTAYVLTSHNRITTNKTRIISHNQQMMRLDEEIINELSTTDENALLRKVQEYISTVRPDVIIFEDYNKGILTEKVILEVLGMCKKSNVITAVDPKRKNFFAYKNADIFKPNLKEVKEALHILVDEINKPVLKNIHEELKKMLHHSISFITLSERGVFYQQDDQADIISSHIRNVADVSGAGDTVIAVAALVYAVTKNAKLMAEMANIAGGLVCEDVGTVAINRERLMHECELLLP